ncbi:uncharacterized protein BT62DRAFT_791318 [Guyanagaster necrorhizus]|uniref:Uncharacterized protein n=1 Tax=Guyanagaster necrorhizus TaxID=856835 RepID=A0A9P7VW93_9AGAR|nr:uncharacterized protein BT62DRAFT_791318 [Guyanagaster necrorhizus MCA 3950]KAG7447758.1 hypothetical protein BT62DRAFT_791318 [Guyanagaster necrorhizus MCA 3950]
MGTTLWRRTIFISASWKNYSRSSLMLQRVSLPPTLTCICLPTWVLYLASHLAGGTRDYPGFLWFFQAWDGLPAPMSSSKSVSRPFAISIQPDSIEGPGFLYFWSLTSVSCVHTSADVSERPGSRR